MLPAIETLQHYSLELYSVNLCSIFKATMSSTSELTNLTPEQESQIRSGYEESLRYSISYFREAIVPIALFAPLTTLYITFILFCTPFQRQNCGFWCLMLAFGLCIVQLVLIYDSLFWHIINKTVTLHCALPVICTSVFHGTLRLR